MSDDLHMIAQVFTGQINAVFGEMQSMTRLVEKVADGQVGLSAAVDTLSSQVAALSEKGDAVQEALTRLRVDMMDRLDRQQDSLSAVQDNIRVNFAAVQVVRDRESVIREEHDVLAKQVSLMHRQLIELTNRFDRRESGA